MIVECGNCQTRFQLDDSRVPESGIRVRCSRCKEAFFLEHASASQAETVDAIAREAAHGPAAPGMTRDLRATSHSGHSRSFDASGRRDPGLSGAARDVDEESDWEFNEDDFGFAAQGDSQDDSAPATDAGLGAGRDPEETALSRSTVAQAGQSEDREAWLQDAPPSQAESDQSGPDASGSALEEASPGTESAAVVDEDDPFGAVDDFSALADPNDDPSRAPEPVAEAPAAASPGADQSLMQDGDLDDPEDWDFFSDESLAGSRRAVPEPSGVATVTPLRASQVEPAADSFDLPSAPATTNSKAEAAQRFGRLSGWAATLGLLAVGIIHGLLLESPLLAAGPEVVALGTLQARGLEGHWVERAGGRIVFVVRGELHNPGAAKAVPGASLRIVLRSDALPEESLASALAGTRLPERELRELRWGDLQRRQERAASALSWSGIPAGGSMRFAALFAEVPTEATRFRLEVAPPVRPPGPAPRPRAHEPVGAAAPASTGAGGEAGPPV